MLKKSWRKPSKTSKSSQKFKYREKTNKNIEKPTKMSKNPEKTIKKIEKLSKMA